MTVVYIIIVLAAAFFLLELFFYLAAFQGRTWQDFTRHNFFFKPELREYADLILSGVRYCHDTPHERVTILSRDGLKLSGKLYDAPNRRGVIVLCHGYRSVAENDFSCSSEYMHSLGFAILLIDQRAHGKSGGAVMTFGVRERWDAIDWAKAMEERFPGEPILLEGLSMGAATVLMAAGEELPESVVGIIADCGYTSPKAIIRSVISSMHLPAKLLYPLVRLSARLFGRFDPEECAAVEAVKRAKVPALFIHGEADDFVPCEMSRQNYAAYAGQKTLLTVPGAKHGLSYVVDMPGCQRALNEFLDKVLDEKRWML